MANLFVSVMSIEENVVAGKIRSIRPHYCVLKMRSNKIKDPVLMQSQSSFSHLPPDPKALEASRPGSLSSAKSNWLQVSRKSTTDEKVVAAPIPVATFVALVRTKPSGRNIQLPRSNSGVFVNNTSINSKVSRVNANITSHHLNKRKDSGPVITANQLEKPKISSKKSTATTLNEKRAGTRSTAIGTNPSGTLGTLNPFNSKAFAAKPSLETGDIVSKREFYPTKRSLYEECNDTLSNGISNDNNHPDNVRKSSRSQISWMQEGKSNENGHSDLSHAKAVYIKYAPEENHRIIDQNEDTSSPQVTSQILDHKDPDEAFNVDLISALQKQESDEEAEKRKRSRILQSQIFNFEVSYSDTNKLLIAPAGEDDKMESNFSEVSGAPGLSRFYHLTQNNKCAETDESQLRHDPANLKQPTYILHTLAVNFEELRQLSSILEQQRHSSSEGLARTVKTLEDLDQSPKRLESDSG
jgi:hypothetical protein